MFLGKLQHSFYPLFKDVLPNEFAIDTFKVSPKEVNKVLARVRFKLIKY